jgi:hypothetical protein
MFSYDYSPSTSNSGETCVINTGGVGSRSPRDKHETNEQAQDLALNVLMLADLNRIGYAGVVCSNTVTDGVVVVVVCFTV